MYTPREVAELLGVSKTTVYRWMDAGEIPYVQMGKDAQKLIPKAPFLEKFGLDHGRNAPAAAARCSCSASECPYVERSTSTVIPRRSATTTGEMP